MSDLPDYYTQAQISEAEAASVKGGLDANKSATPVSRQIYMATDTGILYVCVVDGVWTGFDAAILTQGILTLYENMAGGGKRITNIADPTAAQDAATRAYVLARSGLYLPLAGGTMAGAIAMGANKITGLADPTLAQDAATRAYVLAQSGLYLPLTGGTLTGDLLIGANLLKTTNCAIKEISATTLGITDDTGATFFSLYLATLLPSGSIAFQTDGSYIQAKDVNDHYLLLKAWDTGGPSVEIARLQGAADPYFAMGGSQEFKFLYSGAMGTNLIMGGFKVTGSGAPADAGDALIKGTRVTVAELPAMTDEKIWKGTGANVEEVDMPTARTIATGSYTGNDGDNRQIAVGFKCSMVILESTSIGGGLDLIAVAIPNMAMYIRSSPTMADATANIALHATDGFVVQSAGNITNYDASPYYYWAISE